MLVYQRVIFLGRVSNSLGAHPILQPLAPWTLSEEPWLWRDLTPLHLSLVAKNYITAEVLIEAFPIFVGEEKNLGIFSRRKTKTLGLKESQNSGFFGKVQVCKKIK